MQRLIWPWEYRHLRAFAAARFGGAIVAAVCGILTLSFGGSDGKTYAWAALFLGIGALNFATGYWELTIARTVSPRN